MLPSKALRLKVRLRKASITPDWLDGHQGVQLAESIMPYCSLDGCSLYDGKRCSILGCKPSRLCEPAVGKMAEQIFELR